MKRWLDFPHWFWVAIGLVWLDLFRSLEYTWRFDPQYFYGYLIPVAGGFLFWRAWQQMPRQDVSPPKIKSEWLVWSVIGVCWLVLTVLLEVFVYGRLFLWSKALLVVGVTAWMIWRQGGMAAVRSLAMLLVFLLLAVPWPTRLEGPLVGGLALAITTVTVDLLNVLGYTVLQQGRLIEFGGAAPLGVEEACSGIRSLQLSLAFSLYFGELQRLILGKRFLLLLGGVVLALLGNLVRTLGLSYMVIEHGMEHFEFWHDVLGGTVIAIVLGGLWGLGNWIARGHSEQVVQPASSEVRTSLHRDRYRFAGIAAGVLVSFVIVQSWFWLHETDGENQIQVSWDWKSVGADVNLSDLPDAAAEMLGYEYGVQGLWTGPENRRWLGAFVNWDDQVAALSSELHRPDVCLRAAGNDLLSYHDPVPYRKGGLEVEIKCYSFRAFTGEQFYVFYAFWMDGHDQWTLEMGSLRDYFRYALQGIRFQGAKMVQIYAPSGLTERQAKSRVVEILDTGLKVSP
ncbi:MAG: exosortase/archaeosortase family protein [Verrucomicrobiota bacterium]